MSRVKVTVEPAFWCSQELLVVRLDGRELSRAFLNYKDAEAMKAALKEGQHAEEQSCDCPAGR